MLRREPPCGALKGRHLSPQGAVSYTHLRAHETRHDLGLGRCQGCSYSCVVFFVEEGDSPQLFSCLQSVLGRPGSRSTNATVGFISLGRSFLGERSFREEFLTLRGEVSALKGSTRRLSA